MVGFLAVVVLIVLIIYVLRLTSLNKTSNKHNERNAKSGENFLYKSKGIKDFVLKGMYYRNLDPVNHEGYFNGYAKCDTNSHDRYAVGVYNQKNELLGYTPKGNKRLNNSISQWNNGSAPAWGSLRYDNYQNRWYGNVLIAVGFDNDINKKIYEFFELKKQIQELLYKKEKSTEKYFEILAKHTAIKTILKDLSNINGLQYQFQTSLIPSISSHLEKEKNWEKLIELENYMDLISQLSEKFKVSTLRRIEKAKKMHQNTH
jgi:hypothetical protein